MASLTRVRFINFPKNYFHVLSKQSTSFRHKQKVFFHISSLLNGSEKEITMPSLSPTMSEGKIVKWLKKEGDEINPGDVLCDIETDKAVISMDTEEEGVLAKIIVPENVKDIKVGTLIALIVEKGENWRDVTVTSKGISIPSSTGELSKQSKGPPTINVTMPSLSPTMSEGKIVKWLKKEGDIIAPGDVLCDIETDKAIVSMETEEEGILAKILIPEGTKSVNVGNLIALLAPEGSDWKSVVIPDMFPPPERKEPSPSVSSEPAPVTVTSSAFEIRFGPAVRSLLETYNLKPNQVKSTGKKNRILKEDVLRYISENKVEKKSYDSVADTMASPSRQKIRESAPKYVDIELSNVRKVIAKRLSQSKQQIPHSYGSIQCSIDKLLEFRKNLQKDNIKVSLNDFVIKAVAAALKQCPELNVHYENDVKLVKDIDISIAVATDSGLITPIIKSANSKGIIEISNNVRELAEKARSGKLRPEEFQGGSFTISNLGMYGITEFSAIINPPQCAILAVGGSIERLRPDLTVETSIRVTLSYDRRAIADDEAAAFLQVLRSLLEDPSRIIVGNVSHQESARVQL